jgi:glycosyltransferase involved in cell wall biosynthesis
MDQEPSLGDAVISQPGERLSDAETVADPVAAFVPAAVGRRVFVRLNARIYPEVRDYLVGDQGFTDLVLLDGSVNPLDSWGRYRSAFRSIRSCIRHLGNLRQADLILVAPKSVGIILKMMGLFGLAGKGATCCYGFFSHSSRALRQFRWLARLDREDDRYIVFSVEEARLYAEAMDLPAKRFMVLPYSDWDQDSDRQLTAARRAPKSERYFFSGGYSNRDYAALIEVFRGLPHERLVIVCSAINKEVEDGDLPANVTVERDLPIERFNALIQGATGCILPIRNPRGPAGQSVLVAGLKYRTPVIVTDTPVVREYIEHGVTGYLVKRMAEMPALIAGLDPASADYQAMADAGQRVYRDQCSFAAVTDRIDQVLCDEVPVAAEAER